LDSFSRDKVAISAVSNAGKALVNIFLILGTCLAVAMADLYAMQCTLPRSFQGATGLFARHCQHRP
jgi:hypothetical protein